jgi:hypothetical protein
LVSEISSNPLTGNVNLNVSSFSSLLMSSEFSEQSDVTRTGYVTGFCDHTAPPAKSDWQNCHEFWKMHNNFTSL